MIENCECGCFHSDFSKPRTHDSIQCTIKQNLHGLHSVYSYKNQIVRESHFCRNWCRKYPEQNHIFLTMCPIVVCRVAGDIIFAVDASGSVGKANFQKLMDAVLRTVLMLDLTTSVGNAGARVIFTFLSSVLEFLKFWKVSHYWLFNENLVKNSLLHLVSSSDHCVIKMWTREHTKRRCNILIRPCIKGSILNWILYWGTPLDCAIHWFPNESQGSWRNVTIITYHWVM